MQEKRKLAVVWPWSLEFCATRFTLTTQNLERPEGWQTRFFQGRGWCAARRHNHCLEQALHWGADLICIIGADQSYWTEDMLPKLVARQAQCNGAVTALIPTRGHVGGQGTKPFQPIIWAHHRDEHGNTIKPKHPTDVRFISRADGDFVKVNGCGSGTLIFPADALKHIKPPWFIETPVGPYFERASCTDWPFVNRLQWEADLDLWCDTTILVKHLQMFEIDDTFSERFADWETEGVGDPITCEYRGKPRLDGLIEQAWVSPSLPFYRDKFLGRYGLKEYNRVDQPAFFFGCYTKADWERIREHQSTAVIIWAGTDALLMRKFVSQRKDHPFSPNIKHVAISKFIADDLAAIGLSYVSLPLCNVEESKFLPASRRDRNSIYAYIPKTDREKYGGPIIEQLKARLPQFNWIIADGLEKTPEQMAEIYGKCFVGVRPTMHDGLSNTAVELGLCGRPVIWNGNTPNALGWTTIDDIEAHILAEHGTDDHQEIAEAMRRFIQLPDGWNDTSFYSLKTVPDGPKLAYDYESYFDFRYEKSPRGAGGPDPLSAENRWTQITVREILDLYECESVTEVGCGAGVRWDALPRENYVGLDVSSKAVEHAQKKFPGAVFWHCDATIDDIPKADAVIAIDVLQHIRHEDIHAVFAKMCDAAHKVVIIKTSIGIPELSYQFSHDWEQIAQADTTYEVPGVPVSRVFVFEKKEACVES